MKAQEVIAELNMQPHPEGGYFVETFRDENEVDGRSVGTAIYFLLKAGESSHWHTVDAAEIWFYHAGAPLELCISKTQGPVRTVVLGADIAAGQRPQGVVPPNDWQSAKCLGSKKDDWSLVSCTVSPGFEFDKFVLAEKDWAPGK